MRTVPSDDIEPLPLEAVLSFEDLFRRQRVPMLRLARLLLGPSGSPEDVVHDAFARIYRRYSGIANPAAYLRTTVVNGCRAELRKREVVARVLPRLARRDNTEPGDYVLDALGALPRRQRMAVVLRYYEDLPDTEIASLIGCRTSAVRSLLHHGLEALRRALPS